METKLPVPANTQLQRRDSTREKEVFGFAMNYIMAILAGKIKTEAACDILHKRFPTLGFDKAKADFVKDKKRIMEKRARKSVMIIDTLD
jgi:hypothetical protein